MNKPKLGIDIDEILRAKMLAFDRYYTDEFGEDGITQPLDTYNLRNHYEFKETEEVTKYVTEEFLEHEDLQKVSPKHYVVDETTGRASIDDFAFNTEKKVYSADEMYHKFLYEDYCLQIHGSAPKIYLNADVDLNVFLKLFGEYFDVSFYAKSKKEAISATLFFLSKMRTEVQHVSILYSDEEIWNKFDWIITTDPDVLLKKPEGKVTIKMTRMWNSDNKADFIPEHPTMFGLTSQDVNDYGQKPIDLFKNFLNDKLKLNL